jgi:hypothetical protein
MRHRISLLLAAVLGASTLTLLAPAPPASAWVVCAGTGTAFVTPGLLYPVLLGVGSPPAAGKDHWIDILIGNTNTLHSFGFGFDVGGCVHPPGGLGGGFASGVLLGYCGHSVGTGTVNGVLFAYVSAGGFLILTGHLVGLAYTTPTPGTASCLHLATNPPTATFALPGGATTFTIWGAAGVGFNCAADLTGIVTAPVSDTEVLIRLIDQDVLFQLILSELGVHVHLGLHFWYNRLCVGSPVL